MKKFMVFMFINFVYMASSQAESGVAQELINAWDFSIPHKNRCGLGNQMQNNSCIESEYVAADAELNKIYKALIADLLKPAALKKSQMAWIGFRDAACAYELSGSVRGGSAVNYQMSACLIDLTEKRILDLKKYSSWTYDGSPKRKR